MESKAKQIAKGMINKVMQDIDKALPGQTTLIQQIMNYRGNDLEGHLLKLNPDREQDVKSICNNTQFIKSMETIKSIL